MPELVVLVVDDATKVTDVLNIWLQVGVSGVTLLESSGLGHEFGDYGARNDLPLMPSLASLLRVREEKSRTLFTIVPDDFDIEALITATEIVTGELDNPDTGILFTLPISRARGLHRRQKKEE
jgi:hypothetical protein